MVRKSRLNQKRKTHAYKTFNLHSQKEAPNKGRFPLSFPFLSCPFFLRYGEK